jgi:RecA-family ATPase
MNELDDLKDILTKNGAPARPPPHTEYPADRDPQLEPEPAQAAEILPFKTFKASDWQDKPIEPRRWVAHHRIPVGEPGIMSGDGGTGKTKLMQQLGVAVVADLPDWAGGVVETHGPVVFCSAEEKLKEFHRRTVDVVDYLGLPLRVLNHFHFICDHDDPVLGKLDKNQIVQPTLSLLRLEKTVALIRPALVAIENAADVYAGNESDRANVTRFVRGLLGRLTVPSEAAVALIQHPSLTGLTNGTGTSGSTGWNNSGRWRMNFTAAKGDDEGDDGLRQLHVVKNNYGRKGEKVRLRWDRGVFDRAGAPPLLGRCRTARPQPRLRQVGW